MKLHGAFDWPVDEDERNELFAAYEDKYRQWQGAQSIQEKRKMHISKTTAAGILSALIGVLTSIMTFQVPAALLNPQASRTWLYIVTACNLGTIILRVIVGALQNDAPPPGMITTSQPTTVKGETARTLAQSGPYSTLRAIAIVALAIAAMLPTQGCSGTSIAQDIVNWTPTVVSTANTLSSVVSSLAPADQAIIGLATAGFDAAANLLSQQAQTYLKNPSATALGQLQAQVTAFQQNVNAALLKTLQLSQAAQARVLVLIQALATGLTAIIALVASISKPAAKAQMQAAAVIKTSRIEPLLLTPADIDLVAVHYQVSDLQALGIMQRTDQELALAGL